jgi:hypothetical protein
VADDPLPAALAEAREAAARVLAEFSSLPLDEERASSAAGALWCKAGRLLKAVESVLEHHKPVQLYGRVEDYRGNIVCGHDGDYDGDLHYEGNDGTWYCKSRPTVTVCASCCDPDDPDLRAAWPCPTYAGIARELTGEADGR